MTVSVRPERGTVAEALWFVRQRDGDITPARERYVMPPCSDSQRVWNVVQKQWECCEGFGEQWVGTLSTYRLIYIDTARHHVNRMRSGDDQEFETREIAVEIWSTEKGYEARLDELAGVVTEPEAA